MNRNYRLIWSAALNMIVAVAETARSKGKCTGGETSSAGRSNNIRRPRLQLLSLAISATLPVFVQAQTALDFSSGWNTTGGEAVYLTSPSSLFSKGSAFTLTPPSSSGMYQITANATTVNGASAANTALGLTSGTLQSLLTNSVTNFGILTNTVSLSAGTYSFAWAYNVTDPGYDDGALFSVTGAGTQIVSSLGKVCTKPKHAG